LRVNPPDKWSYVTTKQELDAYYNSGAYYGFGFGTVFDQDGKLWIIYTFKSSPLATDGIGRGWQISKIDGVAPNLENYNNLIGESKAGISKSFEFISPLGSTVSKTYTKFEVVMNTVIYDSVYTISTKKIGYMVFNSFINPSVAELDACFTKFKNSNVDELIVDLRYNGGGSVDVSKKLADLIGGNSANGGIYTSYVHNNKHSNLNKSINFQSYTNSLSLSRVLFITSHGTASASELVISGLKPFMPVVIIGSTTHGKPVGMYVFEYNEFDWAFVPICFSMKNANGVGDYFEGLSVDVAAADDYTSPFGSVNEDCFAAALTYLGVSPAKAIKTKATLKSTLITGKGLYEEIGAW
jgi:carboxyl-terminal processing protease